MVAVSAILTAFAGELELHVPPVLKSMFTQTGVMVGVTDPKAAW
jgi:hypothetical protein